VNRHFFLHGLSVGPELYKSMAVWLILKNTVVDRTLTCSSETLTLTKRDRKQVNIFERKVYRRILGPLYDNKKKLVDINPLPALT
jgi:hypothetical protein